MLSVLHTCAALLVTLSVDPSTPAAALPNINHLTIEAPGAPMTEGTGPGDLQGIIARYYDPQLAIWASPDPMLQMYLPDADAMLAATAADKPYDPEKSLAGSGGVYNPVNIAVYHYAALNPLIYIDPNGLVDLNLFADTRKDKNLRAWAEMVESPENTFTVGAHALPGRLWDGGVRISPAKLAKMIRDHPNYKEGMTVRLMACRVGASPGHGKEAYAQQLADILGTEVEAPKDRVWYYSDGTTDVSADRTRSPASKGLLFNLSRTLSKLLNVGARPDYLGFAPRAKEAPEPTATPPAADVSPDSER